MSRKGIELHKSHCMAIYDHSKAGLYNLQQRKPQQEHNDSRKISMKNNGAII
jgi:hypothetical protein